MPQWAPTRVVSEPGAQNRVLELRDEEPYDMAVAERVFPASERVKLSFRVQLREIAQGATCEIEVQSQRHHRPMRIRLNKAWLSHDHGRRTAPQMRIAPQRWYEIELDMDCASQSYSLSVDGSTVQEKIPFTEKTPNLERIVFRTGSWQGLVPSHLIEVPQIERPGGLDYDDLPGADTPVAATAFWIDDLKTQ